MFRYHLQPTISSKDYLRSIPVFKTESIPVKLPERRRYIQHFWTPIPIAYIHELSVKSLRLFGDVSPQNFLVTISIYESPHILNI